MSLRWLFDGLTEKYGWTPEQIGRLTRAQAFAAYKPQHGGLVECGSPEEAQRLLRKLRGR